MGKSIREKLIKYFSHRAKKHFKESNGQMIEKLKEYYINNGIYPLNFNCKHYPSCVSMAQNKQKFTKGHGIWVGKEYEKGKAPKLLFLSLDSGSAELDPNKRTMEAAWEWNLKWLPGKGDKPKHWYRTHQFAWHVFNEFNNTFNTNLDIGNVDENYDFNPLNEIHKIKPYYAAANSAKCCMNNEHRSQADSKLFENCREYIIGELAILDPDILVTQGKYARMVAEKMKIKKFLHKENISGASSKEDDYHILQINNGKTMVWVHHYHPNNYGTFKKNRDNYIAYAKKAVKFIKNGNKEANISIALESKVKSESVSDRMPKTDVEVDKPRETRAEIFQNEKVKTKVRVKKLNIFEEWKYTEEWLNKKFGDGINKKDIIRQALKSEDASFDIRFYIYENGPSLAPVQRHINRFIDMINKGQFDKCKDYREKWNFMDRLESMPNYLLEDTDKDMDRLYAYNYQKAPAEIVKLVDFIDKKRREAKKVLDALIEQLRNIAEQDEKNEQEYNYQELLSDYEHEHKQTDLTNSEIGRNKMKYEPFDLPTYYVLGQYGYTVRPQQGTGLVITILFEHTEDGTGITEEGLLNEARNSSIGQRLIAEKKCNLTPGHRSNRVKMTLGYLRSKKVFPDKPAIISKGDKLFLNRV